MKTLTLSAIFDGEHIRLEEPYPIPPHTRILVTLLPKTAGDEAEFRQFWNQLATQNLARAYGAAEPEYTHDMVKEPNPEYVP